MKTQFLGVSAFVAMLLLAAQQTVQAQPSDGPPSPRRIAAECIRSVASTALECAEENAEAARRCVRRIERLLADGQVEEARMVARRCIEKIHADSDECVEAIRERCVRCIDLLLELDEVELAESVADACERAVRFVRQSQRNAVDVILDAFDE